MGMDWAVTAHWTPSAGASERESPAKAHLLTRASRPRRGPPEHPGACSSQIARKARRILNIPAVGELRGGVRSGSRDLLPWFRESAVRTIETSPTRPRLGVSCQRRKQSCARCLSGRLRVAQSAGEAKRLNPGSLSGKREPFSRFTDRLGSRGLPRCFRFDRFAIASGVDLARFPAIAFIRCHPSCSLLLWRR
jgi:hypothetical protein